MSLATTLKAVFSTIRTGNLLIIASSLFLIRYTLVKPLMNFGGLPSTLTDQAYMLLVLIVVLIAAGGYIINDYFDLKIDLINKPGKNKIGSVISNKNAIVLYLFLTLSGLMLSVLFGKMAGIKYPVLVVFICAGLLYFYSSTYKKMLLAGNFIISFLAGITIYFSILFDKHALLSDPVMTLVSAYAIFAFILTFIREIIKDCEDAAGDHAFGSNSLPVIMGLKTGRSIASVLVLLTFLGLCYIQYIQQQWKDPIAFIYVCAFIQAPLIFLCIKTIKAKSKEDDHFNSSLSKAIMLTGIFSMFVFYMSYN